MTAIEKIKSFTVCDDYEKCKDCPIFDSEGTGICQDILGEIAKKAIEELEQGTKIEELETDAKLQEQYVKHLEQDKENMKKIINILCDTISQLI